MARWKTIWTAAAVGFVSSAGLAADPDNGLTTGACASPSDTVKRGRGGRGFRRHESKTGICADSLLDG